MADFDTAEFRAARFSRSRVDEIANRTFPVAMRGYDRAAVDTFLQEVVEIITELESRQTQDTVVQRAIAEVGEETAGILQRAHETAEEIAARSARAGRGTDPAGRARGRAPAPGGRRLLREDRLRHARPLGGAPAADRGHPPARRRRAEHRRRRGRARRDAADARRGGSRRGTAVEEDGPPTEEEIPPTTEVEFDVLPGGAAPKRRRRRRVDEDERPG